MSEPAALVVVRGPQVGERLAVPAAARVVIGRDADADVRLLGRQVSRAHCAIERGEAGGFLLRDLGSGNGTYVNGRRVESVALADGDLIACGDVECRFAAPDARVPERTLLRLPVADDGGAAVVVADRDADALAVAGAGALSAEILFELATVTAREHRVERLCHAALEACLRAFAAQRGAVVQLASGADDVDVLAVRRGADDPREVRPPLHPEALARAARHRRALALRTPRETVWLAPVPGAAPRVLYLSRDAAGSPSADERALAGTAAAAALLGRALDRLADGGAEQTRHVQLRLMIEGASELWFLLDDEGRVTYGNRGLAADDPADLLGRRLAELVPLADREELLAMLDRVLEGDERGVLETALHAPDGGARPVRLELQGLRNPAGNRVGIRGVAHDLREVQLLRRAGPGTAFVPGATAAPPATEPLVGRSAAMRRVLEQVGRAQGVDYPVLVRGETGTGKELVARAIHAGSGRQGGPFVPVNCAALPDTLLEAELFGHARGAFTGAHQARVGLIASADGGTLFLDEVGEMEPAMQARLLRVLEDREVRPVGRDAGAAVDVRIVAATHRDLAALAGAGRFRQDLLFRLDVIRVELPALRERLEDLPALATHALALVEAETGLARSLAPEALALLARYRWPGNVRELINAIRRAAVTAAGPAIGPADLAPALRADDVAGPGPMAAGPPAVSLKEAERDAMERALRAAGGSRKRAAVILGMPRSTFFRRLKEHGLSERAPGDRDASPEA